ncbi:MAG: hypothetical protein MUF07_09540 [Steroidobacteraceae bacterium]|nr:hypothetical protein [Steroidobacteraceae bacterium]
MSTTRRVSLSGLAVNTPPDLPAPAAAATPRTTAKRRTARGSGAPGDRANKLSGDGYGKSDERVQVAFRMDRHAYKELRRQALDEDVTVNDLILAALNQYRSQKGLKKLAG